MAEGPNVGYSTLSVIPTLRGLRQELESQLEDPLQRSAARAGQRASDELQSAFASTELVENPDRLFAGVDTAANRAGSEAASQLEAASSEFRAAGERLSDAAASSFDLSPAAAEAAGELSRQLDSERGSVSSAGERLGREAGDGFEDALRQTDVSGAGRELGAEAGGGVGGGFFEGLGDLGGGIDGIIGGALEGSSSALAGPALAIGAGLGALFVNGFADALERGQIESQIQAALGATDAEAARLGALAGDIYSDNFGESVAQVGESIRLVQQNFAGSGDLGAAELRKINEAALTTVSVFDQDLRQTINATSQLIRTGLANDSTEAFDLITAGLQGSANKADDLLDTFNEYSTQFRELGLEGPEALGLITQAVEAGARDADIAADALKEFAIRAQDGSKTTADGFAQIGLSAQDMGARVAAGGDQAKAALQQTLEGLRGIEDPALRSQTAVALFGTQAEDLGDALFALDLDTAAAGLGDIDGRAQEAADSFDDTATAVSRVKRELGNLFAEFANRQLDPLADLLVLDEPSIADVGTSAGRFLWNGFTDYITLSVAGLPGLLLGGIPPIGDLFGGEEPADDLEYLRTTADGVNGTLGFLASQAGAVGDEVAGAAPKVVDLSDRLGELGADAQFSAEVLGITEQRVSDFVDALSDSSSLDDFLATTLDLREGLDQLGEGLGALQGIDISDAATGITDISDAAADALGNVLSVAGDVQAALGTAFEFGGAEAAQAKAAGIRDELGEVFRNAGLSTDQINELFDVIGVSEKAVDIAIQVSGAEEAFATFELINGLLEQENAPEIPAPIQQQIAIAVDEGRLSDAATLLRAWYADIQDGLVQNPLIADIIASTQPAQEDLDGWIEFTEGGPPVEVPVGADTAPAAEGVAQWGELTSQQLYEAGVGANTAPGELGVDQFGVSTESRRFDVPVGADTGPGLGTVQGFLNFITGQRPRITVDVFTRFADGGLGALPIFGGSDGNPLTPRAEGGPIAAGDLYMVGEREPELFVSDRAGRILNQQQIRDELPSSPAGASEPRLNLNYTVNEVRKRSTPEDLLRVTRSALFRGDLVVTG